MVATDTLSRCLDACSNLYYHQVGFDCDVLEQFRRTAFEIIRSATMEDSHQGQTIKRCLWDLLKRVSESPSEWEGSLSDMLAFGDGQFVETIRRNLGGDIAAQAMKLEALWDSMVKARGGNPVRKYIRSSIKSHRNSVDDFRILTTAKFRPSFKSILEELELDGADVFCTSNTLKKCEPFATLITCGPFRENDLVFTAPRYSKLLNVRWASDEDIAGFPEHIAFDFSKNDADEKFPSSFPVNVDSEIDAYPVEIPYSPELKTLTDWSFDEFEAVFIKRRRRYRGYLGRKGEDQDSSVTSSPIRVAEFVKVVFFDGSYVIFPFDQQRKPPLLFSIDRESDFEIKKRRPIDLLLPRPDGDDEGLEAGMLVVLEPNASESLVGSAFKNSNIQSIHLRKWKAALKEKLNSLRAERVSSLFEMQRIGLTEKYKNIQDTVRWWSRYKTGRINSPEDEATFKTLIGEYVGYKQWKEAWFEIKSLRGASISQGLISNSNIDQYLKTSVEHQFAEIVDSPKSILEVKGFENEVVVIEIAEMLFLTESQVGNSPINEYCSTDEELLGE